MKKLFFVFCVILLAIGIFMFWISQTKEDKISENTSENTEVVNQLEVEENIKSENKVPEEWSDDGIFKEYYEKAYKKLQTLTLEEKIGQIFLVRYPDNNATDLLNNYYFGGYLLFEKDFENKAEEEVKEEIKRLQTVSRIPLLIAVDEEGGSVVRVSSNPNLSQEQFKSPSTLYNEGGFEKIKQDTMYKSKLLNNLGINLNLAPVVDVCPNLGDYMYDRSLKENTELTSIYAKTAIEASKHTGVSYTLKHFPGYGNNTDTHKGASVDSRSYESILKNDIPPFQAGIEEGAEAVLVSHNIVTSIDGENPASLSKKIHELLRNDLNFTGIIITDNLDMQAVASEQECIEKAILAGNDILIVTDYKSSIETVKKLLKEKTISQDDIDKMVFHILSWKYAKGLI